MGAEEARMTFMDTPRFRRYEQQRKRQTHCHVGHPLTAANTREQVSVRNGREYVVRICKACERERQKRKGALKNQSVG